MGRALSMRSVVLTAVVSPLATISMEEYTPASYFAVEVKAILSKERFRNNGVGNKVH